MKYFALAIVLGLAAPGVHSQCSSQYGGYLNCIKDKIDRNYGAYENELGQDYKKLVFDCFSTNPSDAINGRACVMRDIGALDGAGAFNETGPLGDCTFCVKLAQQVQKMFLEAPEHTMRCIRTTVSKAIGNEIGNCIKKRERSFIMPNVPDFDEKSQPFRSKMIDNTGVFIQADYMLSRCEINSEKRQNSRNRQKRSAYSNSRQCIANRKVNGRPVWTQTCNAITQCHNNVPSSCKSDFRRVEGYACGCIEDGRKELQDLIRTNGLKLIEVAKTNSQRNDACFSSVSNPTFALTEWKQCSCKALVNNIIEANKERVDVRKIFEEILDCTDIDPRQKELVSLDKLMDLGCRRVARVNTGSSGSSAGLRAAAELATGLDFVAKLLDALVARITRFCPGAHCSV